MQLCFWTNTFFSHSSIIDIYLFIYYIFYDQAHLAASLPCSSSQEIDSSTLDIKC